jgi:hypothetical protein
MRWWCSSTWAGGCNLQKVYRRFIEVFKEGEGYIRISSGAAALWEGAFLIYRGKEKDEYILMVSSIM